MTSENRIGSDGARSLSKALAVNTTLTHLDLSRSYRLEEKNGCIVSHIWLSDNSIGSEGAQFIGESLKTNLSLNNFNLYGTSVLVLCFRCFVAINFPSFTDNSIGTTGAQLFSEALQQNTSLTILDLGGNGT